MDLFPLTALPCFVQWEAAASLLCVITCPEFPRSYCENHLRLTGGRDLICQNQNLKVNI